MSAAVFCHRCGTVTASAVVNLSSGLIGNVCADCRACRRGRPYLGRWRAATPANRYETRHEAGQLAGQGVSRANAIAVR